MYTNAELKADARFHLKGAWGYGIVLILIVSIIQGVAGSVTGGIGNLNTLAVTLADQMRGGYGGYGMTHEDLLRLSRIMQGMMGSVFIVQLINFLIRVFLIQPFQVSSNNWFIRNRELAGSPPLEMVFNHFSHNYAKLLLGRLWETLWMLIWSLPVLIGGTLMMVYNFKFFMPNLLAAAEPGNADMAVDALMKGVPFFVAGCILCILGVIPVINRSFAYALNSYILADNPNIGCKKSLDLSKQMMRGNKFRAFGLALSFVGWAILGVFACGIGLIFVSVYINQTMAEFYSELRSRAVASGNVTMEDFGFSKMSPEQNQGPQTQNPYDPNWQPYITPQQQSGRTYEADYRQNPYGQQPPQYGNGPQQPPYGNGPQQPPYGSGDHQSGTAYTPGAGTAENDQAGRTSGEDQNGDTY